MTLWLLSVEIEGALRALAVLFTEDACRHILLLLQAAHGAAGACRMLPAGVAL